MSATPIAAASERRWWFPARRRSPVPRSTLLDKPLVALALAAALYLPWHYHNTYWLKLWILTAVIAMVNMSWNLILGYGGILSFAQLALYVLGGYAMAYSNIHWGFPPVLGILTGGVAALLASLVIGLPSLRLKGAYVFLLTVGFHEFFRNLFILDTSQRFGGQYGLSGYDKLDFGMKGVDRWVVTYYVALALLVVTGLIIWKIIHSPFGLAFTALRDAEAYAVSRGVPNFQFRLLVFAISAFFTGIAGGFYAAYFGSVAPSSLSFGDMMRQMTMIVVGGWGTFWGPIIGTVAFRYFDEWLRDYESWRTLIFGITLVVFVILLPQGLVGPLANLKNRAAFALESRLRGRSKKGAPG